MTSKHLIPSSPLALLAIMAVGVMTVSRGQAQEPPTDTTEPPAAEAPEQPVSIIEEEPERRDPFWPVGYSARDTRLERERLAAEEAARRAAAAAAAAAATQGVSDDTPIEWPTLKATGQMKDARGNYMAIISGVGLVEEGRVVAITKEGLVYRIKISKIDANGITTEQLTVKRADK